MRSSGTPTMNANGKGLGQLKGIYPHSRPLRRKRALAAARQVELDLRHTCTAAGMPQFWFAMRDAP